MALRLVSAGKFLTPLKGLSTVNVLGVTMKRGDDLTVFTVCVGRRCTMAQRRMESSVLEGMKVVLVIGCVFGLLTGCSSRLRTTIVSGNEPTKVHVTQLKPERLVVEQIIAQPMSNNPLRDIPVEEPARPVMQQEFASDIFTTPKTSDISSEIVAPLKSAPASAPPGEQRVSSRSLVAESATSKSVAGIPPMSIEPEMPALPRLHDEVSSAPQETPFTSVIKPDVPLPVQPAAELSQESPVVESTVVDQAHASTTPDPFTDKEPMQLAKVIPQEPGMVEMTTETLEAALSDIYFDYDQFVIRDDAMPRLEVNAQLLIAKFAGKHIVIEGHCDERGTQSYNMVLGKRRAHAVKRFLEDLGVPAENLQAVSYGKDKPFCTESTQDCWQENRRGHFLIQ